MLLPPSGDLQPINEIKDQGKGRAFIILFEDQGYRKFAEQLFEELSQTQRAILLETAAVGEDNWRELTALLKAYLGSKGIRQASFVCFAAASSIILNLTLQDLKQVRSLVLVDAATRPHPSNTQVLLDKIERFLPLGLPLRSKDRGFDAKSFLQRLRCPILIVTSDRAGSFILQEAEKFIIGLPTAWSLRLTDSAPAHELTEAVLDFQKTPAKCPQKTRISAALG